MLAKLYELDTKWRDPAVWTPSNLQVHLPTKALSALFERVHARDNHTCRFCGFRSHRYQEVHHFDLDHMNFNESNLVTICQFCHSSFHLGHAAKVGLIDLIYLPELSQVQINHLVRSAYVAMATDEDSPAEDAAQQLVSVMNNRAHQFFEILSGKTGSVDNFVDLMARCPEVMRDTFLSKLDGMRYRPNPRRLINGQLEELNDEVRFWLSTSGPYGTVPTKDWFAIWKEFKRKVA